MPLSSAPDFEMVTSRSHRTPRYIFDRLAYGWWLRRNRDKPWLVAGAIEFLDGYLKPADRMVEFGSGHSTMWFAERVRGLVSVEGDPNWHASVLEALERRQLRNVRCLLVGAEDEMRKVLDSLAEEFAGEGVDIVLNDGLARDQVAIWAVDRLAPGGILIIDNVNRFLPSATRSPRSLGPHDLPTTELWREFARRTSGWRRIWWSNGVFDTAVLFKPNREPVDFPALVLR